MDLMDVNSLFSLLHIPPLVTPIILVSLTATFSYNQNHYTSYLKPAHSNPTPGSPSPSPPPALSLSLTQTEPSLFSFIFTTTFHVIVLRPFLRLFCTNATVRLSMHLRYLLCWLPLLHIPPLIKMVHCCCWFKNKIINEAIKVRQC